MDPERWARAKELYAAFSGLSDEGRREALAGLDDADTQLRPMLESMFAGGEGPPGFLDTPAMGSAGALLRGLAEDGGGPDPAIGWRLGPYEIKARVGAGGMGAVYLAERVDGQFDRRVAIKLVKRGLDTEEIVERFGRERQLLAGLDHPNIARLLEGGVAPDGRPYLVMSYIEGRPIDEYSRMHDLSIAERLRLFCTVCGAVHHAHQNLVVHRDLKPAHILVSDDGVPRLLDFGIAKVLGAGAGRDVGVTAPERRLLTPGYASPEQVLGTPVSTSTDIYSLGVVLYQLLSGEPPYRLATGSDDELRRVVCETNPPPPGQTARRSSDLGVARAARLLDGDLDNIVLMAMRKEPERRYASAEHLAADIRRHLEGHPVLARPSTFGYRACKFVRRHRLGVGLAAAAALLVSAAVGGVAWQAHIAGVQRDRAVLAHEQADQINEFLQSILQSASAYSEAGPDVTVKQLLESADERARLELAAHPAVLAPVLGAVGAAYSSLGLYDRAEGLLRDAVEMTRGLPGGDHDLPARLNDLATFLYAVAEFEEAERLIRESIEIADAEYGRQSEVAALGLNNLGAVLRAQGRLDEAEPVMREALLIRERLFGPNDLAVAETLNNLGYIQRLRGDMPGCVEALTRSLQIRETVLGQGHPLVAQSTSNLAVTLHSQGDLDRAAPLYGKALAGLRAALDEGHPDIASTLLSFGLLQQTREDSAAAEPLLRESFEIRVVALGEADPRTVRSRIELGRCLTRLGEHREAIELLRVSLELIGAEGRYREDALAGLIEAYEAAGMPEEAEALR